jgi:hypothetical protein
MADQGFIVNDATVSAIATSYAADKAILLHEDSTADANSKALPQACFLSHLELQLDTASGSPTKVSAFLTYDSSGDDPLTGESADNTLHAGITDTSLVNTAIDLTVYFRAPAGQTTAGKLYLFLKVDAGTVNCTKARLHWAVRDI